MQHGEAMYQKAQRQKLALTTSMHAATWNLNARQTSTVAFRICQVVCVC